jgi:hypothetical protein
MSGDMYDWERCNHRGIGNIGCPVCDPDKGRVMIRQQRLDNRDLRARVAELEALIPPLLAAAEDGWGHNPKGKNTGECTGCDAVLAARKVLEVKP